MICFRISEEMHGGLRAHLFPGDGLEAVSLILCAHHQQDGFDLLTAHTVINVPYEDCERSEQLVVWDTSTLNTALELADENNWSIFKVHSHPTGYARFSEIDDESDKHIMDTIHAYTDQSTVYHGSLVMLPDGKMFGRIVNENLGFISIDRVSLVGSDLKFWDHGNEPMVESTGFQTRNAQTLGSGTVSILSRLRVGVVGCSGLGSPIVELLYRLGIGKLVLIDPDTIEDVNLNRIIQSQKVDATCKKSKVDVFKEHYDHVDLSTEIECFECNVYDSLEAINALIKCDVLVGGMDSAEGRYLLNCMSTFYLHPFLDMGVDIDADGMGGIDSIVANLNYILPGESLIARGVFTLDDLEAEGLKRTNPEEYSRRKAEGYVKNADVPSPAVIAVNTHVASMGVMDLLSRIHTKPLRYDRSSKYKRTSINLCEWDVLVDPTTGNDKYFADRIGKGDVAPLLDITELSKFN